MKPIYIQIAEWLETEIMNGEFLPHDKVFSQYQLAEMFTINPATAAKGLNVLANENILYKKRGLGMFVTENAKQLVIQKRKTETFATLLNKLVTEAKVLKISEAELINKIKATYSEEGN